MNRIYVFIFFSLIGFSCTNEKSYNEIKNVQEFKRDSILMTLDSTIMEKKLNQLKLEKLINNSISDTSIKKILLDNEKLIRKEIKLKEEIRKIDNRFFEIYYHED